MSASGAHPIADPMDSLLGWASQTELQLSQTLSDIDFFPNSGLSRDELQRIERFFGTFVRRQLSAGADFGALIDVMPALTATTLIKRASRMVAPENFPVEYLGGLEITPSPALIDAVTSRILPLLSQLGLEVFSDDPVESLELHTGVTSAKIPAVLEAMDAPDFDHRTLDLPQGSHHDKVFAGIEQLRDFSLQHPTSWLDRDRSHLQLAPLIADSVIEELKERPAGTVDRRNAVGVATREMRPRIILDAERQKVCLRLPEQRIAAGAEILWRVSQEGTTRIFRTGRPWGDTSEYSELLDITLDHAIRELTVVDSTNGITWNVPVINSDDPIVVFNPKGRDISAKASVHYSSLQVLCPADTELVDVVTSKPLPIVKEFPVEGWDSWVCRVLDTSRADSLQAVRPGQQISPVRPVRAISPRQRVTFRDPGPAVENLRTLAGLPVHTASLIVDFPPTLSGADETWYLSISSFAGVGAAGVEVSSEEPVEVPAEGGSFDIFDPEAYDDPWIGEYLVRLRGPRNESFRHEFAIVEGMAAATDFAGLVRSVRIPAAGGLSEAVLLVKPTTKPFEVQPRTIEVAPDAADATFAVTNDPGDQLPIRFIPPRLQFELPLVGKPALWRTTRISCRAADLDAEGTLRLRAGANLGRPMVSLRNQHGAPVRTVKLTTQDGVTYTAPMAQLATTMMTGRLELEWTDPRSKKRASVNLADIDTLQHFEAMSIEDGDLVLTGLATDRPLAAWLWSATAPWMPAVSLDIAGVRTPLPANLVAAGDLIIDVHSSDPFNVLRAPYAPTAAAQRVVQPGFFADQEEVFSQLSAFLAGESEVAPDDAAVMPVLWDYLASWKGEHHNREAVLAALSSNPAAALDGLSASLVPAEKQPGRIIASGLILGQFASVGTSETHRSPWMGALELMGQLPALIEAEESTRDVVKALEAIAGKRLVEALATGRDNTLDTACIDRGTVQLALMDEAQQKALLEVLFAQGDIVPGAIMDDSARLLAVMEAFHKRAELTRLLSDETVIQTMVSTLRALKGNNRSIYASARVRFDKLDGVDTNARENHWALAPVASLVFALAARMHAHGLMGKPKLLMKASSYWAELAEIVPDLVTGDLIAADAMVLAVKYPGI
ncbi:hypothetical protein [Corynebacterium epidermidicanis]|uniref:Uncharacterized protein n=1 Tax=Corynebacterium epidermidicanis TaxID=1050174 RepID=A0A0G3GS92_9CORY|nr:hypothetical protein [Corynebacterium epidermidicanis]AKK03445.1 hypothetical protein CEPID_07975 [Corynebacterium epidermidicanis]